MKSIITLLVLLALTIERSDGNGDGDGDIDKRHKCVGIYQLCLFHVEDIVPCCDHNAHCSAGFLPRCVCNKGCLFSGGYCKPTSTNTTTTVTTTPTTNATTTVTTTQTTTAGIRK